MGNKPRLPRVGEYVRHHGVLLEVITTQPPIPAPITEYVFEDRSARKELRFKDGSILQKIETLNDFYGLGTAEETAIKDMIEYCKEKGIPLFGESDVEVFVVREIDHVAKTREITPGFYDDTYFDFSSTKHRYNAIIKHEEVDVWSSKKGRLSPRWFRR